MAISLVASYSTPVVLGDDNIQYSPYFTPAVGEIIVVKAYAGPTNVIGDWGVGPHDFPGYGLTWTRRISSALNWSDYGSLAIWTAQIGPGQNVNMAIEGPQNPGPAAYCYHSFTVERWSGAQIPASPVTVTTAGNSSDPSVLSMNTTSTGSVITWMNYDQGVPVDTSATAYVSNTTQEFYNYTDVNSGRLWDAYTTTGSPGTYSIGMTAPINQFWWMVGLELQAVGGGSPLNQSVADSAGLTDACTPVKTSPSGSVSYRSTGASTYSSGTTCSVPKPTGTSTGDVLVAEINVELDPAPSMTPPSGWTLIGSGLTDTGGAPLATYAYWKVAGGSEPSTYTWSYSTSGASLGYIHAFSGQSGNDGTINPFGGTSGVAFINQYMSGTTIASASYTASSSGLGFWFWAINHSGKSVTRPSGYASNYTNTSGETAALGTRADVAGSRTTGTASTTDNSGNGYGLVAGVVLNSVSGGAPPGGTETSVTDTASLTDNCSTVLISGGGGGTVPVGIPGNWNMTWNDEFNGTSLGSAWGVENNWNKNGVVTLASNVFVSGGSVHLQLSDSSHGAEIATDPNSGGDGTAVAVGQVIEFRARYGGDGSHEYNWGATWICNTTNWPEAGEYDISEGDDSDGHLRVVHHYGLDGSDHADQSFPAGYWGNAYHTYSLHRVSTSLANVYWDGVLVDSFNLTAQPETNDPLYILLTMGNDGGTYGGVTGSAGELAVDYVRVFSPGSGGSQTFQVSVSDNMGLTDAPAVVKGSGGSPVVLLAFGDMQEDGTSGCRTRIIDNLALVSSTTHNYSVYLGDHSNDGTASSLTWLHDTGGYGAICDATASHHASIGSHDWQISSTLAGVVALYPSASTQIGSTAAPYHSWDTSNGWHIINAACCETGNAPPGGDTFGTTQYNWLKADLDAHTSMPTLVFWHAGRFCGWDRNGNTTEAQDFWALVHNYPNVEVTIHGHNHAYERFSRLSGSSTPTVDTTNGIALFNLAATGNTSNPSWTSQTGSAYHASSGNSTGITRFTLYSDHYTWDTLVPNGYTAISDSGSQNVRVPATGGGGSQFQLSPADNMGLTDAVTPVLTSNGSAYTRAPADSMGLADIPTVTKTSAGGGGTSAVLLGIGDTQLDDGSSTRTRATDCINLVRATTHDNVLHTGDITNNWTSSQITDANNVFKVGTTPQPYTEMHTVLGNHEYDYNWSTGYTWSGPNKGPSSTTTWHSWDTPNGWHVLSLDACGAGQSISSGSTQYNWAVADLQAHAGMPTILHCHWGRYSGSSAHGSNTDLSALWAYCIANAPWVEFMVSGHQHHYERFARMNNSGGVDSVNGIRQFTMAGTGQTASYSNSNPTGLEATANSTYVGITRFTLYSDHYTWDTLVPSGYNLISDTGSQVTRYTASGGGGGGGSQFATTIADQAGPTDAFTGEFVRTTPTEGSGLVDTVTPIKNGSGQYLLTPTDSMGLTDTCTTVGGTQAQNYTRAPADSAGLEDTISVVKTTGGGSGVISAPWVGTTLLGNVTGGNATSAQLDISGATTGEVVWLFVYLGDAQTSTVSPPSGWTEFGTQVSEGTSGAASSRMAVFYKVKQAGDTTATVSWSVSSKYQITPISWPGVNTATPAEGPFWGAHTTGTSYVTGTGTPTAANRWAACAFASNGSTTATAMVPQAELVERAESICSSSRFINLEISDSNGAVTQASHSYTATGQTSSHGEDVLLYLIPAPGGPTGSTFDVSHNEDAGLSDTATPVRIGGNAYTQTPTDSAGLVDSPDVHLALRLENSLSDDLGLTDAQRFSLKSLADPMGLTDNVATFVPGAYRQSPADPLGLTDSLVAARSIALSAPDSAGLTDNVITSLSGLISVSGTASMSAEGTLSLSTTYSPPAPQVGAVANFVEMRLYLDANNYVILPHFKALTFDVKYNDVGNFNASYPLEEAKTLGLSDQDMIGIAIGFGDGVTREVERYIIENTNDDKIQDDQRFRSFGGRSTLAFLEDAVVYPENWPVVKPAGHAFANATFGTIYQTLLTKAKTRGCFPNLVTTSFSGLVDSGGAAWNTPHTQTFSNGTSYLAVLKDFMDRGLVDAKLSGWQLQIYNGTTLGSHIGIGSVEVRPAYNATDMTASTDSAEACTAVLIDGDEGYAVERTSSSALATIGRRKERNSSQGGINDAGVLGIMADAELSIYGKIRTEETVGITDQVLAPFRDFNAGDWIWVRYDTDQAPVERRVYQIAVSVDDSSGERQVGLTLNSIIYENDIRLQRKIEGYAGSGNSYGGTPESPAIGAISDGLDANNAAVDDLSTTVGGYDASISGLQTDMGGLGAEVDTLGSQVTAMGGTVAAVDAEMANVQADLAQLDSSLANLNSKFPITSTSISAGAITTPSMTANSINGDRITANTLNASKIVAYSITGDRISADTITAYNIAANSITANELSANALNGYTITGATIQTSDSGQRVLMDGSPQIRFYSETGENTPAFIDAFIDSAWLGWPTLRLASPGYYGQSVSRSYIHMGPSSAGIKGTTWIEGFIQTDVYQLIRASGTYTTANQVQHYIRSWPKSWPGGYAPNCVQITPLQGSMGQNIEFSVASVSSSSIDIAVRATGSNLGWDIYVLGMNLL